MIAEPFDRDLLEAVASRLDLREPNVDAITTLAVRLYEHGQLNGPESFEGVMDVATGVGKTYVLAGAIEYYAEQGLRNFAVITPGQTILRKTVAQFTPGTTKSLLHLTDVQPVVITSENFPSKREAMDNRDAVKLYVFTVQALTKPKSTDVGRKTHKFQEGLGGAFYEHLQGLGGLIVFADEHHTYYGPSFSAAVRELKPFALVGLTGTPHTDTPDEQIIFRYPLSAAIADKLVKTPVLVGRKDDRFDWKTQLRDGARLLAAKEQTIATYSQETGAEPVRPIMLVICPDITDAQEKEAFLSSSQFENGQFDGYVLRVDSKQTEKALALLDEVEEPTSKIRIIVAVGMLKEGWDVKNVYVIASLRSSVSKILTEQTLGRGLRLPFGTYTGWDMLDTLEVLAHERYEDLLKQRGALNQEFIDYRTKPVVRKDMHGNDTVEIENQPVAPPLGTDSSGGSNTAETGVLTPGGDSTPAGGMVIVDADQRATQAAEQAKAAATPLLPRVGLPTMRVPYLKSTAVRADFSLSKITELGPFRELGRALAANPDHTLKRTRLDAHRKITQEGQRTVEFDPKTASDVIVSQAEQLSFDDARSEVIVAVMSASVVPSRPNERAHVVRLLDALLEGAGDKGEAMLSAYGRRVGQRLIQQITEEHRRHVTAPTFEEVIELHAFAPKRTARPDSTTDRTGPFRKSRPYTGWQKGLFEDAWFDSEPERAMANMLDDADEVEVWVRLHIGDLPILWTGAGNEYNPDLLALDADGVYWIIEIKSDRDMKTEDVQGKRQAALHWANVVSADPKVGATWNYLLVAQRDLKDVRGDWLALSRLTGT